MTASSNAFKVGLMTIGVSVTAFAILVVLSQGVAGDARELHIRFKSVPAMPTITKGSAVMVGGQVVGTVQEAHLETRQEAEQEKRSIRYIRVLAQIRDDIRLRKDCKVYAEGPPLGGDGVIMIDLGTHPEEFKEPYVLGADPGGFNALLASMRGELDGNDPVSLLGRIKTQLDPDASESLVFKIHASMNNLNDVIVAIRQEFDPERDAALLASLHKILGNIDETTSALKRELDSGNRDVLLGKVHLALDAINGGLDTATRMLADNEAPIARTVQHVESTAEKIDNRIAENIAKQTDPNFADGLSAKLNRATEELEAALADIHVVTGTTRDVVVLNRNNINKLILNFKETSDHLKAASKYIWQRPWRLFKAPDNIETKQHEIFDAARNFAEAATRLDDATAQLNALAELHDGNIPGDSPDLARIRTSLTRAHEKFTKAEAALWRHLDVK